MRQRVLALTLAAGGALSVGFAAELQAFEILPGPDWCENGVMVEVGTFSVAPHALERMRDDDECPPDGDPLKEGECGQFDDDYDIGTEKSSTSCAHFKRKQPVGSDIGSVIAIVTHPENFPDPLHGDEYSIESGVAGICVRCEASDTVDPVTGDEDH